MNSVTSVIITRMINVFKIDSAMHNE